MSTPIPPAPVPVPVAPSALTITRQNIEDVLALVSLALGVLGNAQLTNVIPGVSGVLLGIVGAAIAKSSSGLGQDLHSVEDWIQFLVTFFSALASGLTANPQYVTLGVPIGFIGKALPSLAKGVNFEDVGSAVSAFLALYGGYAGNMNLVTIGLIAAAITKAAPSLVTNGTPATTATKTAA